MTKPGADGSRKSSRRINARDKITSSSRNPLQEVFEQHGGYACHHDLGERGGTTSTNDTSDSAEEKMVASNDLPQDVQNHQALESMSAARHLENAIYQELLEAANKGEESVSEEGNADTNSHVEEELMNMEAIQDAFNSDVDEILSENAISACMAKDETEEEAVSTDDVEEDHDIGASPGAQYIYPSHSQPSTAEESQEDDASIVYDLFHRPASPYLAEVIPEAIPVDFDISLNCCVKVDSAAVVSVYKQNILVVKSSCCSILLCLLFHSI